MEWLLAVVLLGAGGAGGAVVRRLALRRRDVADRAGELEAVRAMADEDTTLLGEQLSALGRETEGRELDEATRADYQSALDAYDAAKRAVPRLNGAEQVSAVVDTLSSGRYALACVQASIDGRPRPELRVPCFFNPQHGPSVRDVRWTVPGGRGTRTVPACAQDAARVAAGEDPNVRQITVGTLTGPYWEAGAAYLPYGENYYQTAVFESSMRRMDPSGPLGGQLGGG